MLKVSESIILCQTLQSKSTATESMVILALEHLRLPNGGDLSGVSHNCREALVPSCHDCDLEVGRQSLFEALNALQVG